MVGPGYGLVLGPGMGGSQVVMWVAPVVMWVSQL